MLKRVASRLWPILRLSKGHQTDLSSQITKMMFRLWAKIQPMKTTHECKLLLMELELILSGMQFMDEEQGLFVHGMRSCRKVQIILNHQCTISEKWWTTK
jgi:hypothetical protein